MRQSLKSHIRWFKIIKQSERNSSTDNDGEDEKCEDPSQDVNGLSQSGLALGLEAELASVFPNQSRSNEYPRRVMDVIEISDLLFGFRGYQHGMTLIQEYGQ